MWVELTTHVVGCRRGNKCNAVTLEEDRDIPEKRLKEHRRNNRIASQYRLKLGSGLKGVRGARLKYSTTVLGGIAVKSVQAVDRH